MADWSSMMVDNGSLIIIDQYWQVMVKLWFFVLLVGEKSRVSRRVKHCSIAGTQFSSLVSSCFVHQGGTFPHAAWEVRALVERSVMPWEPMTSAALGAMAVPLVPNRTTVIATPGRSSKTRVNSVKGPAELPQVERIATKWWLKLQNSLYKQLNEGLAIKW